MTTRPATVAGTFYPADGDLLQATVRQLLDNAKVHPGVPPKALIVPHAGYVYSGPIAATAYRLISEASRAVTRVVLIGPAHRVPLSGMAFPSVDAFVTPGGTVPLDRKAIDDALNLPGTVVSDEAHDLEHCLEVQLPFLEAALGDFELVPFLVGQCPPQELARVLEALWGGEETLIVVSSDLSHYHSYEDAQQIDAHTTAKIAARATDITGEEACGATAINGLMLIARGLDLSVHTLDVRNSGDTAGDRSAVVGYGAYALG